MKKVYLIHGWGGSGSGGWFDWLKKELDGKAEVIAFNMSDTENPVIEKWVGFLQENVKNIDEKTYFVGHSIGCQTILRYLEKSEQGVRVAGCVFVAGWFSLNGLEKEEIKIAKPWLETKIDFEKVKKHCNKFLAIFSDNDPYVPLSDIKLFEKNLGAETIIKKNHEHFNNVEKIQEVLEFIEK